MHKLECDFSGDMWVWDDAKNVAMNRQTGEVWNGYGAAPIARAEVTTDSYWQWQSRTDSLCRGLSGQLCPI